RIIPCLKFGVKFISIQFFLSNPDDPVIWRGPMVTKALTQMLNECVWDGVEILLIDMPPGTGDIQLSLSQLSTMAGVILVSTPQQLSVSDVAKAGRMFEKVNVPVLGIVENMVDDHDFGIFGIGGVDKLAESLKTNVLARIPLRKEFVTCSDQGHPIALSSGASIFLDLADKVLELISQSRVNQIEIG
ncbi:MAG: Mrp/NBP35 family ATP-binding protein, partial [Deltaproteobacteria bacterium]|nr:Mrp/NBP35 family ATP-binding protein [Deltaproteobacteria bacterium]